MTASQGVHERILKINDLLFDLQINGSYDAKDELHILNVRLRFLRVLLRNQIFSSYRKSIRPSMHGKHRIFVKRFDFFFLRAETEKGEIKHAIDYALLPPKQNINSKARFRKAKNVFKSLVKKRKKGVY